MRAERHQSKSGCVNLMNIMLWRPVPAAFTPTCQQLVLVGENSTTFYLCTWNVSPSFNSSGQTVKCRNQPADRYFYGFTSWSRSCCVSHSHKYYSRHTLQLKTKNTLKKYLFGLHFIAKRRHTGTNEYLYINPTISRARGGGAGNGCLH